jgi:hypothetical protein
VFANALQCFLQRISIHLLDGKRDHLSNALFKSRVSPSESVALGGETACHSCGICNAPMHADRSALPHRASLGCRRIANQDLERNAPVGWPLAFSSSRANRFGVPLGWLPAEKARNLPLPNLFKIASARIDRAELAVHKTRTLIMPFRLKLT